PASVGIARRSCTRRWWRGCAAAFRGIRAPDGALPPVRRMNVCRPNGIFYDVLFVDFGDGRERGDLPSFLFEDMTDEIVFVQTLHDDDDRAPGLVIEARIERAVEP